MSALDELFATKTRKATSACRLCGAKVEANVTIEVREKKDGKFGRRLTRSLAVCGPCAVSTFEALSVVLERGSEETQ